MGSGAIKWHVHCSVCGAFIEKSAQSDSEVECKKCRSTLEIFVKDDMVSVRPIHIRDEQLKSRMRTYSRKMPSSSSAAARPYRRPCHAAAATVPMSSSRYAYATVRAPSSNAGRMGPAPMSSPASDPKPAGPTKAARRPSYRRTGHRIPRRHDPSIAVSHGAAARDMRRRQSPGPKPCQA